VTAIVGSVNVSALLNVAAGKPGAVDALLKAQAASAHAGVNNTAGVNDLVQGVANNNIKSAAGPDDQSALLVKDVPDPVETDSNGCVFDLATFVCCPCCAPCICSGSWMQLNEKQEAVVLQFGKYSRTVKNPGIRWINCCGANVTKISTAIHSAEVPSQKIVDSMGNPLVVGAIIVYHVSNSYRAAIAVANYRLYIVQAAQAVLKTIVQQHPYEDPNGGESLRKEAAKIGEQLVQALQVKADKAGLKVLSFEFNELAYAPEIAPQMLKKQQAQATVDARHLIVQGAVETCEHAMEAFKAKGYEFSQRSREKMLSDLMAVMVSERDPSATINVSQPRPPPQMDMHRLAMLRAAFPNMRF